MVTELPQIERVDAVDSTNSAVIRRLEDGPVAEFSGIATLHQTAGRGRLGRTWSTPAGRSLAVSLFVRGSTLAPDRVPWVPLVVALAVADTLTPLVSRAVGVKWPNDVLLDEAKVAGVLAERLANGDIVVGIGINLWLSDDDVEYVLQLGERVADASRGIAVAPSPTSIFEHGEQWPSEGGASFVDVVLSALQRTVAQQIGHLRTAPLQAVRDSYLARCVTDGTEVLVVLPDGRSVEGIAVGVALDGRLSVKDARTGAIESFAAGDIVHARRSGGGYR